MSFEERAYIIGSLKGVSIVSTVDDSDNTVCKALERFRPDYFANGGDRYETNTPEMKVCKKLGTQMLWNIGGGKIQSSSILVSKASNSKRIIHGQEL